MSRVSVDAKGLDWQARVDRQAASGLSISAFCRHESISDAKFYYWKRKLKKSRRASDRQVQSIATAAKSTSRRKRPSSSELEFIQLPVAIPSGPACIEITAASGTTIRVPAENPAALRTVLDCLFGQRSDSVKEVCDA